MSSRMQHLLSGVQLTPKSTIASPCRFREKCLQNIIKHLASHVIAWVCVCVCVCTKCRNKIGAEKSTNMKRIISRKKSTIGWMGHEVMVRKEMRKREVKGQLREERSNSSSSWWHNRWRQIDLSLPYHPTNHLRSNNTSPSPPLPYPCSPSPFPLPSTRLLRRQAVNLSEGTQPFITGLQGVWTRSRE